MSDDEQPCFRLQSFLDASPEQITEVVQTNLLGTMLCTRAAMQALAAHKKGGHIFNMDGAGANNLPSPMYAAYGATKAGAATLSPHSSGAAVSHSNTAWPLPWPTLFTGSQTACMPSSVQSLYKRMKHGCL